MASMTDSVKKSPNKKVLLGAIAIVLVLIAVAGALIFLMPGELNFTVEPREVKLEVGQTQQLELISNTGKKLNLDVQWYSEHPLVASVDANGLVTAAAAGETKVTAVATWNEKEIVSSAVIKVSGTEGEKVDISGDETPEFTRDDSGLFIVDSASAGVKPDTKAGTIELQNVVSNTEFFFAAEADKACADAWEVRGTITKENMQDTYFFSFGVKDADGKEQWFCILEEYLSLQRYWDWWSNSYPVDNIHVGFNQASSDFFWRKAGGNNLDFVLVLKDDVLKLYFGNDSYPLELAWSLPLTEDTFGGFAEGSEYQIGLNSVDPANVMISDISVKIGDEVKDLGGIVGGSNADVRIKGDRFKVLAATPGVSFDGSEGTVTIKPTVKSTTMWFYSDDYNHYSPTWEMNGTATKKNLKDSLFLSFGVLDENGKEQWFCIYKEGVSLQRVYNWEDTFQKTDGSKVIFNQPACSFYWKESNMGAEKLDYKLIIVDDVLYAYFGNDKYDMSLAWCLPLTDPKYGGFEPGSSYMLGMNTVDPLRLNCTDVTVRTGEDAQVIPEYVEGGKFILLSKSSNVQADPAAGELTVDKSQDKTQIIFAAEPNGLTSTAWEMSGIIRKDLADSAFLSFGVIDAAGKDQWFCILDDCMALQRYWNWWDTKYPADGEHVVTNTAASNFFYKISDNLHYKIIVKDDVLYAYFGNDLRELQLAWCLPLTEETFGGFAAGSRYKLAINIVDPNNATISDVNVTVGDEVQAPDLEAEKDTSKYKFFVDSYTGDLLAKPIEGRLTLYGTGNTQTYFAASAEQVFARKWEMTGTITKKNMNDSLFLSFGVRDTDGRNQWFCLYNSDSGISLRPTWDWAVAVYRNDGKHVIYNAVESDFFWHKTESIDYKLVLDNDVLKAYFGHGEDLQLAWDLPLTNSTFGGFTAGSAYQLGVYTVDPCYMEFTNVTTATDDTVAAPEKIWDWFGADSAKNREKVYAAAGNDGATTLVIGDSFFDIAFWDRFYTDFKGKDAMIAGIGGSTAEDWINYMKFDLFLNDIAPKNVVINIGNNDIFNDKLTAEEAVANFKTLAETIHQKMPDAKLYQFSITARSGSYINDTTRANMEAANAAMSQWCAGQDYITFVDISDQMTADTLYDNIHPKDEYYTNVFVPALLDAGCELVDQKPSRFEISSASSSVIANKPGGTLTYTGEQTSTQTYFAASDSQTFAKNWTMTGTITKNNVSDSLYVSFGVKDSAGKVQWFCIYKNAFSLQPTWDWEKSAYAEDGVHAIFHQASCSFFWKEAAQGGQKLDYKVILEDDVLKVSFGNDKHPMYQAWNIPLTEATFGGFAAGSDYQLAIYTVDPTAFTISDLTVKAGYETPDNRFEISSLADGVLADEKSGTLSYKGMDRTETFFAASAQALTAKEWELSGTIKKNDISKSLFLSFGVKDAAGKDQWFCILDETLALQRYWDWWKTEQPVDGVNVISNTDATEFFFKRQRTLDFKLVLRNDVLKVYFGSNGNLSLAWDLDLTEELYGGFAPDSSYQLGINTVDPCPMLISNLTVTTGNEVPETRYNITYAGVEGVTHTNPATYLASRGDRVTLTDPSAKPGYTFDGWYIGETKVTTLKGQASDLTVTAKWLKNRFEVASATASITANKPSGTLSYSGAEAKTEMFFMANATETYAKNWTMTGTIEKPDGRRIFISFGIKDSTGKDQWFCIYEDTVALQRYWNWANSKQSDNRVNVIYNQASCSFSWSEQSVGGGKLHYKLVLEGDVLKVYFGNDIHPMALAWNFPLTDAKYGGFAAGSSYQVGITSVDAVPFSITNLDVIASDDPIQGTVTPKFYVSSMNERVAVDPANGTVMGNHNGNTEIFFAANAAETFAKNWEFSGSITKATLNKSMFVSFGVKDSTGKDQWFCIYNNTVSLQRYWNWADTKQPVDNVNVVTNADAENFFHRRLQALDFKLVLEGDVLKVYFGSNGNLTLAWTLDLTEKLYGGFAPGSSYQLAFNTVDPCAYVISDINASTNNTDMDVARTITYEGVEGVTHTNPATYLYSNAAEITLTDPSEKPGYTFDGWYIGETKITTLAGQTGKLTVTAKWLKNRFETASASDSVTVNKAAGTLTYSGAESQTKTYLSATPTQTHAKNWTMTGTITKNNVSDPLFISFGVKDTSGKEQWFCIYKEGISLRPTWDWETAKYGNDGVVSIFHQASCSFYWKEAHNGGQKLDYKVVLENDVLKVSFGNDMYPMYQAWNIPLTEATFGGFAAGSDYQMAIYSVDPTAFTISDIYVSAGYETPANRFELSSLGSGVLADKTAGTLSYMGVDRSEVVFAASAQETVAKNWELSGKIRKNDMSKSLFLSFGVKDTTGKEKWFCILDESVALQRYWDWWETKQPVDGVNVISNNDAKEFFFKRMQTLEFRLVLEGDMLKAYFGNNGNLSLAWDIPLTDSKYGGFAIGSSYQLAINTVDACPMQISNITVVTGNEQVLHERTITYEGVEGVTHTNPATYVTVEAAGITLSDPTAKPGYTFDGWYIGENKVTTLEGQTRDLTITAKWLKHRFELTSATSSITADKAGGTLTYSGAESKTQAYFAASTTADYAKTWKLTGTLVRPDLNGRVYLSFGVKDSSGKEQWFCIFENCLSLVPDADWGNARYAIDHKNVIFNQPSCSFYWREDANGAKKLNFVVALEGDVLKAYFGNDVHQMSQAWSLNLTDSAFGGFAAGSDYQLAINTYSDGSVPMTISDIAVNTGYTPVNRFELGSISSDVLADETSGTLSFMEWDTIEVFFAASEQASTAKNWEITGTISKNDMSKSLFPSFGVKDSNGKDQWFCILDESMALQRNWNWWDSKQPVDGLNVHGNQVSADFFAHRIKTLEYRLVLEDDVLKAYFGNNGNLTLTWNLDLTDPKYGGFAAGSSYQIGINTVDKCSLTITGISVSTNNETVEVERAILYTGLEGADHTNPVSYLHSKAAEITLTDPAARTGYTFDGWYIGDTKVTTLEGQTGNITLTAVWTPNQTEVTEEPSELSQAE